MPGTFKRSWQFLGDEVFDPLAILEEDAPPVDMFAELGKLLLSHVSDTHQRAIEFQQSRWPNMDETMQKAWERMLDAYAYDMQVTEKSLAGIQEYEQRDSALDKLKNAYLPAFVEENDIVYFLEKAHGLIAEYKTGWARSYENFLSRFNWKFGLSYEIRRDPFEIRPLIEAEFTRMYRRLRCEKGRSGDLQDLLGDFEHSFALFARQAKPEDLNNALKNVFSYLEGLTGEKLNSRGTSLGDLAKQCENSGLFPHKGSVAKSLSNLYGFPSDYPRLRHAGTPASKIRDLTQQDCVSLSLMALLWAGYINGVPLIEQDTQKQEAA